MLDRTLTEEKITDPALIALRPVELPDDEGFLRELYDTTREDLTLHIPDKVQLRHILEMQYEGQKVTYAAQFPNASHDIILLSVEPIGRLIVDRRDDAIHGVDLALLPEARRRGIGRTILERLFEECVERRVPFVFHVLKSNPAQRLYERLGCVVVGDNLTHYSMQWRAKDSYERNF